MDRLAECRECVRPGNEVCSLAIPANLDALRAMREAATRRADSGIAGLGESGREAGGGARDDRGDTRLRRERADDQPDFDIGEGGGVMARDVKEHPEDLDGLAKNLHKLDGELDKMADAARSAMRGDSHDKVMDAVTEATRASPYGAAHVAVAVVAVLVIALGVAILL